MNIHAHVYSQLVRAYGEMVVILAICSCLHVLWFHDCSHFSWPGGGLSFFIEALPGDVFIGFLESN